MPNGRSPSSGAVAIAADSRIGLASVNIAERHFRRAMLYTALIVLVFWCAWKVERDVLHRHPGDIRYIREASEAAMRYLTIPHILIGFFFMASSPKNQSLRKRMWTVGLLLAGVGLCLVYWKGGAKTNVFLYAGVYYYFLVHELRDEAMFYNVLGGAESIRDKAVFQRMVRALIALIVLAIAAFAWSLLPFGVFHRKVVADGLVHAGGSWADGAWTDGSLSLGWKIILASGPLLVVAVATVVTLRHYALRQGYAGAGVLLRTHAPLFRVMVGAAGVLGLSLLLTQRAYSLILFHVVAWYIFAAYQFTRHPPKVAPRNVWLWMRTTVRGFKTLHLGMVVILMAIGLVWTLWLGQSPALTWLLAPESFLYWTIMHITISFVPR